MTFNSFNEVIESLEYNKTWNDKRNYNLIKTEHNENCKKHGYLLGMQSNGYLIEDENYELGNVLLREEQIVSRTEGMYGVSRKVSPLQRLFSGRM